MIIRAGLKSKCPLLWTTAACCLVVGFRTGLRGPEPSLGEFGLMHTTVIKGNFRPGSLCGPGERIVLQLREKARWVASVLRAGVGKGAKRLAGLLGGLLGEDGRLDPTYGWMARALAVTSKTIERWLKDLRGAGFLTWQRRTVITDRVQHQTSNQYQLRFPCAVDCDSDETPDSAVPIAPVPVAAHTPDAMSHNKENNIPLEQSLSCDIPPPDALRSVEMPAAGPVFGVDRVSALAALADRRRVVLARLGVRFGRRRVVWPGEA